MDRLLVSTEEMSATVSRYNSARDTMDNAYTALDSAWDQLCAVWDGTIRTALMAEWVVIAGNVRKSDLAMAKSIRGLTNTHNLVVETESDLQGKANALEVGSVPPVF